MCRGFGGFLFIVLGQCLINRKPKGQVIDRPKGLCYVFDGECLSLTLRSKLGLINRKPKGQVNV